MARTGLHIDLEGNDIRYEMLFIRVYGSAKEARRHKGDRRHIKNLAYTFYNQQPAGLPSYQEQIKSVVSNLTQVCNVVLNNLPINSLKHSEVKKLLILLKHIENHNQIYPVINQMWEILNS